MRERGRAPLFGRQGRRWEKSRPFREDHHQRSTSLKCLFRLVVEFCDGSLATAVCQLVGDAFAIAFQFGKVFVEDFARPQSGDEVIKFTTFLAVFFRLSGLAFPLTLFFELGKRGRSGGLTRFSTVDTKISVAHSCFTL